MYILLLVFPCIFAIIWLLRAILKNPFEYPYFKWRFDVSGKRNVKMEDYIDNFLRDERNWELLYTHQYQIQEWKRQTKEHIQTSRLRNYRYRQFLNIIDDDKAFHFELVRQQKRYQQRYYIKTSYMVPVVQSEIEVNWQWLKNRYKKLEKIGFEATLNNYNSKYQRKLMTKQLRKEIMERDNYTCQICWKYMPDEVGLHIDHIIPIVKGGKSVRSNLRVLCSKCNGHKGAK